MGKTSIEWCTDVWNPITGCTKVSQGCKHCYAERVFPRAYSGQSVLFSHSEKGGPVYRQREFTDVQCHPERLEAPLHWKKPRRVFVNSMSDLFHEAVPDEFINQIFAVMCAADQHSYQILTKRPQRMLEYMSASRVPDRITDIKATRSFPSGCKWSNIPVDPHFRTWPPKHVQLGVSCEDQPTADERIPFLIRAPAAVRFVSLEPLLGQIDLRRLSVNRERPEPIPGKRAVAINHPVMINALRGESISNLRIVYSSARLDWVIAGGESGRGEGIRPMHPDWVRSLRDQCVSAGVPFFFKQWGEWVSVSEVAGPGRHHHFEDGATVRRTGKKIAGAVLDGREWREFPQTKGR